MVVLGRVRSLKQLIVEFVGRAVVILLPLSARKAAILWLGKRRYPRTYRLSFLFLRDLARKSPSEFHKFLWSNHLGHAETYEIERRYADPEPTRRILFQEICAHLRSRGIIPERDVKSVFDAGCSLGHVLRFAETDVFPSATILTGVDVDSYAVSAGSAHLRQLGSKVQLNSADLSLLEESMNTQAYDVIICFGVLMYLDRPAAAHSVKTMLQHCGMLLALSSWPHPVADNSQLSESVEASRLVRHARDAMDGVILHNLDAMVQQAGGRVVSRRWTGSELVGGDKPLYFVLASR